MAGVIVRDHIHDAFMSGPDHAIEFFHGFTYSGHPLACAAAIATLDVYRDERLFERAKGLENVWADAFHILEEAPNVVDVRTVGLVGAVDLATRPDVAGARGFEVMERLFHEEGMMARLSADTIACSPPLIVSKAEM
jgi:beta-alanine--pyruvate transaminase